MNIKEKIGERILAERKAKGLTRKALAELTDDLKQSRINNWERGYRTPGPVEIKQLAKALEVSAAFLMCLTDDRSSDEDKKIPGLGALIPVLNFRQIEEYKTIIDAIRNEEIQDKFSFIPVSSDMAIQLSGYAYAIQVSDDSMSPELLMNDLLIVDPEKQPKPGNFVIAKIEGHEGLLIRKYKQLSVLNKQQFELLAVNENWASVLVENGMKCGLWGSVVGLSREFGV